MASSKTEICNMALVHLGQTKFIDSFDDDRGKAAECFRLFYEDALKATFRSFTWPFATKIRALEQLTEYEVDADHPSEKWQYSYRMPADALMLQKIESDERNDNRQSREPYEIIEDDDGSSRILTDREDAIAHFTIYREDVERYPSDFVLAFSRRLAALVAPGLTAGDPFKLQRENMSLFLMELQAAQGSAANEEQPEEMPDAEHLRARIS